MGSDQTPIPSNDQKIDHSIPSSTRARDGQTTCFNSHKEPDKAGNTENRTRSRGQCVRGVKLVIIIKVKAIYVMCECMKMGCVRPAKYTRNPQTKNLSREFSKGKAMVEK